MLAHSFLHLLPVSAPPHPPIEVELVGQHPPVVPPGLGRVQAAAQLLPDGEGDAEGVRPHQRGDVTGRVQQRRVDALGVLQRERR